MIVMIVYVLAIFLFALVVWQLTRPFHSNSRGSPSGLDALQLRLFVVGITKLLFNIGKFATWLTGSDLYVLGNNVPCKRKSKMTINGVDVFYFNRQAGKKQNCFIFIHGGAFILPHIYPYDMCLGFFAKKTNALVLSIDYRLAPVHTYPAAHDDCYKAVHYILSNPSEFNINTDGIVLCGDSAGGNLVAWTCLQLAENHPHLSEMVKVQILVNPLLQCADFCTPSYQDAANYSTYLPPSLLSRLTSVFLTGTDKYAQLFLTNKVSDLLRNGDSQVIRRNCNISSSVMDQILVPFVSGLFTQTLPSNYPPANLLACEFDVLFSDSKMFHDKLLSQNLESTLLEYKTVHDGFLFSMAGRSEDVRMLMDIVNIANSAFAAHN